MTRLVSLMLLAACAPPSEDGTPTSNTAPQVCGPDEETGLRKGKCAPDFEMPDRYGEAFTLYSQRGKVALVDISAVW